MCPECGAARGRVTENDETDEGYPLRERLCPVCEKRYPTVELPVKGATISQLGTKRRDSRRESARRRRGFHGMACGTYHRPYAYLIHSIVVSWTRPRRASATESVEDS